MTNTTRIIFVRHARSQYGKDDRIRPLTDDGLKSRKIVVELIFDGDKLIEKKELAHVDTAVILAQT